MKSKTAPGGPRSVTRWKARSLIQPGGMDYLYSGGVRPRAGSACRAGQGPRLACSTWPRRSRQEG